MNLDLILTVHGLHGTWHKGGCCMVIVMMAMSGLWRGYFLTSWLVIILHLAQGAPPSASSPPYPAPPPACPTAPI